ncbi:MAG: single-stranded DNA-binding protein [Terriglobia bacterium]
MSSINKVFLIGRLGKDPEVKYTNNGAAVAKFSVATDEVFKDRSGEQQKHTEWHNIVAWNKLAEICGEYLTKGKQVFIEGSIRSRQWEDQSGNKRTSYEIIAREMKMLGSKSDSPSGSGRTVTPAADMASSSAPAYADVSAELPTDRSADPGAGAAASSTPEMTDDDIPF